MNETITPLFNGIASGIFPILFAIIFALPVALIWWSKRSTARTRAMWTLAAAAPLLLIYQLTTVLTMLAIKLPPKSDAPYSISILLYVIAMYICIRFRQSYTPTDSKPNTNAKPNKPTKFNQR